MNEWLNRTFQSSGAVLVLFALVVIISNGIGFFLYWWTNKRAEESAPLLVLDRDLPAGSIITIYPEQRTEVLGVGISEWLRPGERAQYTRKASGWVREDIDA